MNHFKLVKDYMKIINIVYIIENYYIEQFPLMYDENDEFSADNFYECLVNNNMDWDRQSFFIKVLKIDEHHIYEDDISSPEYFIINCIENNRRLFPDEEFKTINKNTFIKELDTICECHPELQKRVYKFLFE